MQHNVSKSKEVLNRKQVQFSKDMAMLKNYASGSNLGAYCGGMPEAASANESVTAIVSAASKDVYNLYHDKTRTPQEQIRLAAMVAKNTEKRLGVVSEQIFKQITANQDKVSLAYQDMQSHGETSNHPRSQAIRSRLQGMKYADLITALESDKHTAGIFLSDPEMLYDLDAKQQASIRSALLSKSHPEAHRASQSHDNLFTAYESLLTNTKKVSDMMANPEDVEAVKKMRVESVEGRFDASGRATGFYGGTGIDGSAGQFGGKSAGFNHLPSFGNG